MWNCLRATDCANILLLACKLLIRLRWKILRATDEPCSCCSIRAIMRRAMLRHLSISGGSGEPSTEAESRGVRGGLWLPTSPQRDRLRHVLGSATHLRARRCFADKKTRGIPARSHVQGVGYPTSIPPRFLGYPTEIPGDGVGYPMGFVGSRDISPLDFGIT
jgi:hypothetical protein